MRDTLVHSLVTLHSIPLYLILLEAASELEEEVPMPALEPRPGPSREANQEMEIEERPVHRGNTISPAPRASHHVMQGKHTGVSARLLGSRPGTS